MKVNAVKFNFEVTSNEFRPQEEFPDIGGQDFAPKKKKNSKEELEAQKKKAQIEALPTKGKPAIFFLVGPQGFTMDQ